MNLTGFDKLLQESLGVSQRKQQELEETSKRMENKFNPLNFDNVEHVDGDTFRLKDNPDLVCWDKEFNRHLDKYDLIAKMIKYLILNDGKININSTELNNYGNIYFKTNSIIKRLKKAIIKISNRKKYIITD